MGEVAVEMSDQGGESAKPGPGPFYTYVVWRNLAYPKKNDTIHQML